MNETARNKIAILTETQLMRVASSEPSVTGIDVRIKARRILKALGYRFIGTRIEKDE